MRFLYLITALLDLVACILFIEEWEDLRLLT